MITQEQAVFEIGWLRYVVAAKAISIEQETGLSDVAFQSFTDSADMLEACLRIPAPESDPLLQVKMNKAVVELSQLRQRTRDKSAVRELRRRYDELQMEGFDVVLGAFACARSKNRQPDPDRLRYEATYLDAGNLRIPKWVADIPLTNGLWPIVARFRAWDPKKYGRFEQVATRIGLRKIREVAYVLLGIRSFWWALDSYIAVLSVNVADYVKLGRAMGGCWWQCWLPAMDQFSAGVPSGWPAFQGALQPFRSKVAGAEIPPLDILKKDWLQSQAASRESWPEQLVRCVQAASRSIEQFLQEGPPTKRPPGSLGGGEKPRHGGRKRLSPKEAERRETILGQWPTAAKAGVSRATFCKGEEINIEVKDLKKFQE